MHANIGEIIKRVLENQKVGVRPFFKNQINEEYQNREALCNEKYNMFILKKKVRMTGKQIIKVLRLLK